MSIDSELYDDASRGFWVTYMQWRNALTLAWRWQQVASQQEQSEEEIDTSLELCLEYFELADNLQADLAAFLQWKAW